MIRVLLATVAILSPLAAVAEDLRQTAQEVAIDPDRFIDRRVIVTGCGIVAHLREGLCGVRSKTGFIGNMWVDIAAMPADDKRFLTTECASFVPPERCTVTLSAVITRKGDDIWLVQPAIVRD